MITSIILAIFCFQIISSVVGTQDSPIACSSQDIACKVHGDNQLGSYGGVANIGECRQLCYDNNECEFITYYDATGFPFREVCLLFRACEETQPCSDCISETRGCYETCGALVVGPISDNLLQILANVESESKCKQHCGATNNCSFYTYFKREEMNADAKMCILMSSVKEPLQQCDSCVTGPVDCQEYQACSLLYNGESHQHLMVTDPGLNIVVTVPHVFGCQMRVLAIGSGGRGGISGGGSGYIQYQSVFLNRDTLISLNVGERGEASTIMINGQIIEASSGHDGGNGNGGDGYSGGGGDVHCNGGSDGGDGEGSDQYNGGRGAGDDVTSYKFDNFILSPGEGGGYRCNGYYYGGGGGGVLVNYEGPNRVSECRGEGYGGGGYGGFPEGDFDGLQGVILMELV